jgi:hypothetical protein
MVIYIACRVKRRAIFIGSAERHPDDVIIHVWRVE